MKSGMATLKLCAFVLLWLAVVGGAFFIGRKTAKPTVKMYSDLTMFISGKRTYLIDTDVKCPNGRDLGKVQVDLDLTNGKLHVVRNDPGKEPSCVR